MWPSGWAPCSHTNLHPPHVNSFDDSDIVFQISQLNFLLKDTTTLLLQRPLGGMFFGLVLTIADITRFMIWTGPGACPL